MIADLVALGDLESNLVRMRADANGFKGNKSWEEITYDQVKQFSYESTDVDAMRLRGAKELEMIKAAIADLVKRYK